MLFRSNPWWEVDLGAARTVDKVVLYNRNTAMERINGAIVRGLAEDRSEQFSVEVASVSTLGLALITNTELPVSAAGPASDPGAVVAAQAPFYPLTACVVTGKALTAEEPQRAAVLEAGAALLSAKQRGRRSVDDLETVRVETFAHFLSQSTTGSPILHLIQYSVVRDQSQKFTEMQPMLSRGN